MDEFEYSLELFRLPDQYEDKKGMPAKSINDLTMRARLNSVHEWHPDGEPTGLLPRPMDRARVASVALTRSKAANKELLEGYKKGDFTRDDLRRRRGYHNIFKAHYHRAKAETHAKRALGSPDPQEAKRHADLAFYHSQLYTKAYRKNSGLIYGGDRHYNLMGRRTHAWQKDMIGSIRHLR